ncbi:MAG: hypothetical protein IPK26_18640 [Planctomycetes bacterium]|nr:hypothetical protein [Planctomycetota bacterium]
MNVDQEPPPDARTVHTFAGCLYSLMLVGSMFWLWLRDRTDVLATTALGNHGLPVALGAGLLGGGLGAGALTLASRRLRSLRTIEQRLATALGPLGETSILWLSLLGALAEEMFFRLAVQDLAGLTGSVALYTVMNTGPGFWAWAPVALLSALLFSGLVLGGCGLLAATTAHALMNYFTLRRILPS